MPQADHITYLPLLFWFNFIFIIGYIVLGTKIYISLISTQKVEVSNQADSVLWAIYFEKFIKGSLQQMALKAVLGYSRFVGEKKVNLGRDPV